MSFDFPCYTATLKDEYGRLIDKRKIRKPIQLDDLVKEWRFKI